MRVGYIRYDALLQEHAGGTQAGVSKREIWRGRQGGAHLTAVPGHQGLEWLLLPLDTWFSLRLHPLPCLLCFLHSHLYVVAGRFPTVLGLGRSQSSWCCLSWILNA